VERVIVLLMEEELGLY